MQGSVVARLSGASLTIFRFFLWSARWNIGEIANTRPLITARDLLETRWAAFAEAQLPGVALTGILLVVHTWAGQMD